MPETSQPLGRRFGRIVRILLAVCLAQIPVGLCLAEEPTGASGPDSDPPAYRLSVDGPLEIDLGDRTEVRVDFDLPEPSYLIALVDQDGVDVEVEVWGDGPEPVWRVDWQGPGRSEAVPCLVGPGCRGLVVRRTGDEIDSSAEAGSAEPKAAVVRLSLAVARTPPKHEDPHLEIAERRYIDGVVAGRDVATESQRLAQAAYEEAIESFVLANDPIGEAKCSANLGLVLARLGEDDAGERHLRRAVSLRRELLADGEIRVGDLLDSLKVLAEHQSRRGALEAAASLFDEAVSTAEDEGDTDRLVQALTWLAPVQLRSGDWRGALKSLERADPLPKSACNDLSLRSQRAFILRRLGEFHEALDVLRKAVDPAAQVVTQCREGTGHALTSLGGLYRGLGRFDAAQVVYQRALLEAGPRNEARALSNLAWNLLQMERWQEAADHARRAVASTDAGDTVHATALGSLGLALTRLGEISEARATLEKALETATSQGNQAAEVQSLSALGLLEAVYGDPLAGIALGRRVVAEAERVADRPSVAEGFRVQSLAALRLDDPSSAAQAAERAVSEIESFRQRTAGVELRASLLGGNAKYYETWIRALIAAGETSLALETAERARARSLLEVLNDAEAVRLDLFAPELRDAEKDLALLDYQRRDLLASRSDLESDSDTRRLRDLEERITRLEAKIFEMRAVLRASNPDWSNLLEPEPISVEEIRTELLDEGTALLYYYLGDEQSWLWLLTVRELRLIELSPRQEIEETVRSWRSILSAASRPDSGESLRAFRERRARLLADFESEAGLVADRVFEEALENLAVERLAVVADGALEYLPFAALQIVDSFPQDADQPLESASKRIELIRKFELVVLPSAAVLQRIRARVPRRQTQGLLAVVGDPVYGPTDPRLTTEGGRSEISGHSEPTRGSSGGAANFRRLYQAAEEVTSLVDLADSVGGTARVFTGFRANRDLVVSGAIADHRFVHFATHGVADSQHPDLSALVLSTIDVDGSPIDGRLRLADIYRLDLDAELVTLSACDTALGEQIRGEGLLGLTRGFFHAGAARVVASLWAIDDQTARQQMESFYRELLVDNLSPAEALRSAQLEQLNRGISPAHWAAFVLQGDWKPLTVGLLAEGNQSSSSDQPRSQAMD